MTDDGLPRVERSGDTRWTNRRGVPPPADDRREADRALISAASRLHAVGVAHWFVASHDAVSSALPGSVTILSTGSGRPAHALLQRAVEVRRVA